MGMRLPFKAVVLAVLAFSFPQPGYADQITVTFTAFPAAEDRVNTGPSTGFFTFDSSLIPPGGGKVQDSTFGLGATAVDFNWGHIHYTAGNSYSPFSADLGELHFNASGQLLAWVLGGSYSPFTGRGGIYGLFPSNIDDFYAATYAGFGGVSYIRYTLAGDEGVFTGRLMSDSIAAPTPEPSSLW